MVILSNHTNKTSNKAGDSNRLPTDSSHLQTDGSRLRTDDVFMLAADLVAIPSVSFNEQHITAIIERELAEASHLEITRIGDNLVARTHLGHQHRLVLAGHTDTVPPTGNPEARIEDDVLLGLGATDMKGGVAVLLYTALAVEQPNIDVTYVFYAREEVAAKHNGLREVFSTAPDLLEGDVAVLLEPTDVVVEAGCQGTMRVDLKLAGTRAHTARGWTGRNAIHRLESVINIVNGYEPRRPVVAGCEFHEGLQAVKVTGGIAGNVVPDEACITINHRFAPDRTAEQAEKHLRSLFEPVLEPEDTFEVTDAASSANPGLDHPLLKTLVTYSGAEARAKLGWTDVAFFSEHGIPASNFGPSDPLLAHTINERVHRKDLQKACLTIEKLLLNT